ncbi:stage V sporulation protein AC [uncultured Clostridium sp.]|uniref:stage V sporulation protein AC n=1 Tax=uncultured Clostridium sp. TaxID=59620 RepID=UPI0032180923
MKVKESKIKAKFQNVYENSKPKPTIFKNSFRAFWTGGLICVIGEVIFKILIYLGQDKLQATAWETVIMIFLGALLTGVGIYDRIGDYAGAGSVVPITGFANSIVSPAIEFKKEGYVFGVASKMFTIAGPVLVYSISASVILGILYYIFRW